MIYNNRNQSNNITESQKEKRPVLRLTFSTVSQKSWIIKVYVIGIRCGH